MERTYSILYTLLLLLLSKQYFHITVLLPRSHKKNKRHMSNTGLPYTFTLSFGMLCIESSGCSLQIKNSFIRKFNRFIFYLFSQSFSLSIKKFRLKKTCENIMCTFTRIRFAKKREKIHIIIISLTSWVCLKKHDASRMIWDDRRLFNNQTAISHPT